VDRKSLLSDDQWELIIEPLLPPQCSGKGRPMRDHRQVVEGVIYRYRCGIAWRDLPASFGPWQTVWKRHRRFSGDGTWDKILDALLAQADAIKEIDWTVSVDATINRAHQHATNLSRGERVLTDAEAEPKKTGGSAGVDATTRAIAGLLAGDTGAGSNHKDSPVPAGSKHLRSCSGCTSRSITASAAHAAGCRRRSTSSSMAAGGPWLCWWARARPTTPRCSRSCSNTCASRRCGPGRPRTTPDAVLGDKAYSARAHRELLRTRGIKTVIPEPSDQIRNRKRGSRGGRPPALDAVVYRGRNVVERSFNTVKQWRGLATRYDKLAIVYRGAAVLRAIRSG
jgi:transposase